MFMFTTFASTFQAFQVMYWGILISTALFGITILQAWTYMTTNSDQMYLRILVAILVVLDFCTTVFTGHLGFHSFVQNFGNFEQLLFLEISAPLEEFVSAAATLLIQAFFASRVAILHKGKIAPILILFFALGSAVAGTLLGIHAIINPSVFTFATPTMQISAGIMIGFAVLSDLITTFYLSKSFYDMKFTSESLRTDQILKRLIDFVVRRGILVTVAQITALIVYLAQPDGLYWTPVYFCTSRIYVITMIAMLNGREDIKRNDHGLVQFTSSSCSHLQFKVASQPMMANDLESTVTKPSLIYFQTSSSSRDSNASSVVQEDLEKSAWNNNRF